MITNKELNKLLDVYCKGIYAMDPKTALPFWDYDFGPIFGDLWIKRMLKAIKLAKKIGLKPKDIAKFFQGPSVPRKELIYSLVDLKVGNIPKKERIEFVNFWWSVVKEMCVGDHIAAKANIIHSQKQIENLMKNLKWEKATIEKAKETGKISMCLNSFTYGIHSDIFAHNGFENFGPYDVSKYFGGKKHIMVIKTWFNLKAKELWPNLKDFKFDKLKIFAVYKDMDYTIDIYNHQWYSKSTVTQLVRYAVLIDDKYFCNSLKEMKELVGYIGRFAVKQYEKYREEGFETAKKMWVLQRSYQFKDFFKAVGLDWEDKEMIERVKGKALRHDPYWDFSYPKDRLFKFWKKCFDPRLDTYFEDWSNLFRKIVIKKN